MVWSSVFLVAVIVFFKGKSRNEALANTWKKAVSEAIGQNFAHFGFKKELSTDLEYVFLILL